jgi:hypothetical protein
MSSVDESPRIRSLVIHPYPCTHEAAVWFDGAGEPRRLQVDGRYYRIVPSGPRMRLRWSEWRMVWLARWQTQAAETDSVSGYEPCVKFTHGSNGDPDDAA